MQEFELSNKPEEYGFLNLSFALIGDGKRKPGHVCPASQGQAEERDLWFREAHWLKAQFS